MFMVRISTVQNRIVRVRLGIVPAKFFVAAPYFITIKINNYRQSVKNQSFPNNQPDIVVKRQFSGNSSQSCTAPDKDQRRFSNEWKLLGQGIDKKLVIFRRSQSAAHDAT